MKYPMSRLHLRLFVKRILFIFAAYTIVRGLFLAFHVSRFAGVSFSEVMQAFLLGLRFDASAIMSIVVPFIFLSVLPFPFLGHRFYQGLLKVIFVAVNLPFLVLGIVDLEFYRYTDRRMTVEITAMSRETSEQSAQLLFHYWYMVFLALVFLIALWRFYPVRRDLPAWSRFRWRHLIALPVAAVLTVILIRGSLGVRPLASGHAFAYSRPVVGNLALNTPFVFLKSIQGKMDGEVTTPVHYFPSDEEAFRVIGERKTERRPLVRDNVLLIIVESLSSEYMGIENDPANSYTPFLDELARKSVIFTNHFANSKRSITALPAVSAGIPDWLGPSFSTSVYQNNTVFGFAHELRRHGYQTYFFHGTRDGTMTFDYMSRIAGIENYYALSRYGAYSPEDHDTHWGIFDLPMLQRIKKVFSETQEPFAGVFFTLSTHQPHSFPPAMKGQFRKGLGAIYESMGYTDYALKQFFAEAAKEPWFKHTLFVITADHTFQPRDPRFTTPLGLYDVPLIFYHPGRKLPAADTLRIAHQPDIGPSILDLLGMDGSNLLPFGSSLFSRNPGVALLRVADQYTLVKDNYWLTYADETGSMLYPFRPHDAAVQAIDDPAKRAEYERLIKAYIQVFRNGLIENNWVRKAERSSSVVEIPER